MKYCVDYYKHIKGLDKADEYTIKYSNKMNILMDFLEENETKRVNLQIEKPLTNIELKMLKPIYLTYPNLCLRFESYDEEILEDLLESGIPFFFGNRVNDWDTFIGLLELGVSDIYIVEDLCFDLERVAAVAAQYDVKLRTYANVAQSTWKDTIDIKKFWIRPEDVEIYEKYIDTLEFFGTPQQVGVLLKVYKEDKKWFGQLKEIIFGLKTDLDSRYIIPHFAEHRTSCKKECLKGGKCKICERVVDLSHSLKEANLIITPKKKD